MIISASYKTDIPTFFGDWLMNRIRAGFCKTVNPMNPRQHSTISLRREDVDGIVLWTKNIGPFLKYLPELKSLGYPFIVQYAVNGYPRTLERSVVNAEASVEHLRQLSGDFGPDVAVWRYDTIVFTSETPAGFHLQNFERLASLLEGATNEVVVSFAQMYRKTLRNMDASARKFGFSWWDPPDDEKRDLLAQMVSIAASRGIHLAVCAQPAVEVPGARAAHCVDAPRLARVSGKRIDAPEKGNRVGCRCALSRDIGDYDTCPHGCVYCYAVRSRRTALERFRKHDPQSEYLFPPAFPEPQPRQLKLIE